MKKETRTFDKDILFIDTNNQKSTKIILCLICNGIKKDVGLAHTESCFSIIARHARSVRSVHLSISV